MTVYKTWDGDTGWIRDMAETLLNAKVLTPRKVAKYGEVADEIDRLRARLTTAEETMRRMRERVSVMALASKGVLELDQEYWMQFEDKP